MARHINSSIVLFAGHVLALLTCAGTALADDSAAWLQRFLAEADRGHCIEGAVYNAIRENGAGSATAVVQSALRALDQRAEQQRALGCAGDIAAQAIDAGADPDAVLAATAAGL
ncbi:MAG: hypothetical protein H6959_01370 [Chromatiaceae bacterium]|nr:hypothetical protein [Gammaproteobacteria bacterium]MCP5300983.1 hypothetical protein [Chromatiaceae bacterium]MCP5421544.1 hypothetical protein [Chromatiaceae bacterium]